MSVNMTTLAMRNIGFRWQYVVDLQLADFIAEASTQTAPYLHNLAEGVSVYRF